MRPIPLTVNGTTSRAYPRRLLMSDRARLRESIADDMARAEAVGGTAASALDLLVEVGRWHGYFDMAGFALGVEDLLGGFTQVATAPGLKSRIRQRVLREAMAW